jgi:hypothetical protein
MLALKEPEIAKTLQQHRLVPGATNSHTVTVNEIKVTFTNTPHVSAEANTVARTIGVTYSDPATKTHHATQLIVILKKAVDSVGVTIVPLVHPTLKETLKFEISDPKGAPPAPDFTFSAGWFGFAGSCSEAETQEILTALNSAEGIAVRTAVSAIVAHFNWIAGLIVAFVLASGPFLIGAFDNAGRKQGVCFIDSWAQIWWVQWNPVPWGF